MAEPKEPRGPAKAKRAKKLLQLEGLKLALAGGRAEEVRERSADAVLVRAARKAARTAAPAAGKRVPVAGPKRAEKVVKATKPGLAKPATAAAKVAASAGAAAAAAKVAAATTAPASAARAEAPALPSLFLPEAAGLAFDAAAVVRALARKDPMLGRAMRLIGPLALKPGVLHDPFESLATSIVYQQLNGKAAATILGRVVALFAPRRFPRPQDVIATGDEALRAAGLSRGKTAAIKDLAAKTIEGVVPDARTLSEMSEEAVIEHLTQVRGIGRWTVEMMLMFRLGRPDILPATDFGVRKGFARAMGLTQMPQPKELLAYGERWKPWRTIASWYLWRVCELPAEVRFPKAAK